MVEVVGNQSMVRKEHESLAGKRRMTRKELVTESWTHLEMKRDMKHRIGPWDKCPLCMHLISRKCKICRSYHRALHHKKTA